MGSGTRSLFTVLALTFALLVAALVPAAGVAATKKPTTASALKALVRQTNKLPKSVTSVKKRNQLRLAAAHAQRSAKRSPCASVKDLARYRRVLRTVKVKSGKRFRKVAKQVATLQPASMTASRLLLANKKTKKCGGGIAPSRVTAPQTKVTKSDANGMQMHIDMPDLNFIARAAGGQSWTELKLPSGESTSTPGEPSIPVASSAFAVPDGATVEVDPGTTKSYTVGGVDVFPAQPDVVDAVEPAPNFKSGPFAAPKFTIDKDAYQEDALVPAKPASGDVLGTSRDLVIGGLQIPAAQYNPADKTLKVLTSIDLKVNFNGGAHTFNPYLGSPWEQPARRILASLLNAGVVRVPPIILQPCGEEMLVITNPSTLAETNQFATGKTAQGWRVHVAQTGAGAGQIGTTATQIQTYIRSQLTAPNCIHPTYVTIIGDDELVPTFTTGPGGIPSDLPYSMKTDADELPDVALGRILGNDGAQLTAAITKILGYENTAAAGPFLTHATLAAQFQDTDDVGQVNDGMENRTFVWFAEKVRSGLIPRGITVDRIYEDNPTTNPTTFNDGTPMPVSLQKPAFAWDGDGADVTAAWNEGRFLMIHRDHGWSDGWGDPFFTTTEVDALTNSNALLPVVMSINCASAQYDTDETSFVQNALVKPTGGAVGVFGDTRNSPSWHNSQIGLGFVDGLLPSVLPSEGPATAQRMGDALINGKLRLAGLAPPSGPGISGGDGNTRNELYLWHFFGDPSMKMWGGGGDPIVFNPAQIKAVFKTQPEGPVPPNPPPYFVQVNLPAGLNGQPISLIHDGVVVGKAIVNGDHAEIPADFDGKQPNSSEQLQVALDADGSVPVSAPVGDVPPPPPPPPVDTTVTQSCPNTGPNNQVPDTSPIVINGSISPAFAGATITLTWTRPNSTTFTHTTTTDAKGNWSDSMTPNNEAGNLTGTTGQWTVSSKFGGDSGHNPSPATPTCTVYVFDNS